MDQIDAHFSGPSRQRCRETRFAILLLEALPAKRTWCPTKMGAMALGVAIGVGVGAVIGTAMDNLPLGIAIGISIGAAGGFMVQRK
ncbi:hypothetical protein [Mesorhizobium sp. 1M-11]|uniref:hypothetical protein n=1 Tax=Mesorhizobium sp. 1M-11 TaxID=1529006 RepID=UPI00128F8D64|nr:hypothetical protein [Mesorhizobium sp. 1M-11]